MKCSVILQPQKHAKHWCGYKSRWHKDKLTTFTIPHEFYLASQIRRAFSPAAGSHAHPHQRGGDYACGDDRGMAHPLLLSMQVGLLPDDLSLLPAVTRCNRVSFLQNVWLREHNRIADGIRASLAKMAGAGGGFGRDPQRDDEFIYQVI